METNEKYQDGNVVLLISSCKKCLKAVRVSVKHVLSSKEFKEFNKQATENDYSVTDVSLDDYNKQPLKWCKC
jgi:hypothetical protein